MGKGPEGLLVTLRRILGAVLLASSLGAASAIAGTVDAGDYDAFWLWGGVAPQAVLARARTVYVLQGRVAASGPGDADVVLTAQGIDVPRLVGPAAWLVYRANTLHWPSSVYAALRARLARWREAGNTVAGIQIDFDARASYLHEYAAFLRDLRGRLPGDCRLGVTGLLDWSTNADPDAINELARVVDEVVVQTYQGRRTIPDYDRYLPRLRRLTLPFKVGIIQGGDFDAPAYLRATPAFRGYVVFLQNP
jgi:hypothetical protein